MTTFTVTTASKKKDVPDGKYGPMQVITLGLRHGDADPIFAEWYTRAATQLPQPGATLEGEVTRGQYGFEFKKAQPLGGGGGMRPRDPKEIARIVRQHSQEMALRYVVARGHSDFTWDDLIKLVDAFDNDVRRAAQAV